MMTAAYGRLGNELAQGMTLIYDETKEGDTEASVIEFEPSSIYLYCWECINISTGKHTASGIVATLTPDADAFGTVAVTYYSLGSSGTSQMTVTRPTNTTMTWKCNSSAYRCRIVMYKMGG